MANKKEAKTENPLLSKKIPAPPAQSPPSPPSGTQGGTLTQYGNTVENGNTLMTQNSTLLQSDTTPLEQEGASSQSKKAKITLYPSPEQTNRLYDLMEAYRKRTGIRINQQDVLRRLIEVATIDLLIPS